MTGTGSSTEALDEGWRGPVRIAVGDGFAPAGLLEPRGRAGTSSSISRRRFVAGAQHMRMALHGSD